LGVGRGAKNSSPQKISLLLKFVRSFGPGIIRMIESRGMRWAGHVARMEAKRMHIGYCGKARRKETSRKIKMQVG
jgi:hypothetical protein